MKSELTKHGLTNWLVDCYVNTTEIRIVTQHNRSWGNFFLFVASTATATTKPCSAVSNFTWLPTYAIVSWNTYTYIRRYIIFMNQSRPCYIAWNQLPLPTWFLKGSGTLRSSQSSKPPFLPSNWLGNLYHGTCQVVSKHPIQFKEPLGPFTVTVLVSQSPKVNQRTGWVGFVHPVFEVYPGKQVRESLEPKDGVRDRARSRDRTASGNFVCWIASDERRLDVETGWRLFERLTGNVKYCLAVVGDCFSPSVSATTMLLSRLTLFWLVCLLPLNMVWILDNDT